MDDLQNYRLKIGLFGYNPFGHVKKKSLAGRNGSGFVIYSLVMLSMCGLIALKMAYDPSIESNPGPNNCITVTEKPLVDKLKSNNKDLARIASHRFYFTSCLSLNLVPR